MQFQSTFLPQETLQLSGHGETADIAVHPLDVRYAGERWSLRMELGLPIRTPVFYVIFTPLQVGGCRRLIQALQHLQWYLTDFLAVIAVELSQESEVEQIIRLHGLQSKAMVVPRVPEFKTWILGSDGFVHASDVEIALREITFSQLHGVPVIAKSVSSMPGLTHELPTRLPTAWAWENDDSSDLAFLLNDAIRNTNHRHAIISRARHVAKTRISSTSIFRAGSSESVQPLKRTG